VRLDRRRSAPDRDVDGEFQVVGQRHDRRKRSDTLTVDADHAVREIEVHRDVGRHVLEGERGAGRSRADVRHHGHRRRPGGRTRRGEAARAHVEPEQPRGGQRDRRRLRHRWGRCGRRDLRGGHAQHEGRARNEQHAEPAGRGAPAHEITPAFHVTGVFILTPVLLSSKVPTLQRIDARVSRTRTRLQQEMRMAVGWFQSSLQAASKAQCKTIPFG